MLLTIYYNTVTFIVDVSKETICPIRTLKYNKKSILIISISFYLVYNYREITIFTGKA